MAIVSLEVDIQQLNQLEKALREFSKRELQTAVRAAVKKAIDPMVGAVSQLTPVGKTGLLKAGIATRVKQYPRSGVTVGVVGVKKGFKANIKGRNVIPAKYLHLVAFGHRVVPRKGAGGVVPIRTRRTIGGKTFVRGNPFLARALRKSQRRVLITYSRELGRRVELATKRAARRIKKSKVAA